MKKIILAALTLIVILTTFGLPVANAQDPASLLDGIGAAGDVDPTLEQLGTKTAAEILTTIIEWLLSLVAIIALGVLIWGSLSYILSVGDENKAEKAKKIILYAVVGLVLVGASFLIITVVQNLLTGE
jgi:uncharacterized membrane protein YidH (DUF202 family)